MRQSIWVVARRLSLGATLIVAASVVLLLSDRQSAEERREMPPGASAAARIPRVYIVRYIEAAHTEEGTRGLLDGLREAGLQEGRDFAAEARSAQGDVATLNGIMNLAKSDGAEMVVALCTPTLQAAMQRFSATPVVYSVVASGVQAGAGRSRTDHRSNVTGIDTEGPYPDMAELLKQCLPSVKCVGTLFTPGETNSVFNRDLFEAALRSRGVELVSVPANSPAEVADAATALSTRRIDAVCQIMDNLSVTCFATIVSAAQRAKLPLFSFAAEHPRQGSVLALSRDYYEAGREAGLVAARVLRGESPAQIPFTVVKRARLGVNLQQASKYGISVPDTIVRRADEVIR